MGSTEILRRLKLIQDTLTAELSRLRVRVDKMEYENLSRNMIEVRQASLHKIWDEARQNYIDIVFHKDKAENFQAINESYLKIETEYEYIQEKISSMLDKLNTLSKAPTPTFDPISDIEDDFDYRPKKLPKLELPTFSGQYEEWNAFCDAFTFRVHEVDRFSDATKMRYLESCLTDIAADFLNDLILNNVSYPSCWKAIKRYFSNPRHVVNDILQALMNLPKLEIQSSEKLENFRIEVEQLVRGLTSLGMPVQYWDHWLILIIEKRLDPVSQSLWEIELDTQDRQFILNSAITNTALDSSKRFPKFQQLLDFIERRAIELDAIERYFGDQQSKINEVPKLIDNCVLCSKKHDIGHCSIFLSYSVDQRRDAISQLRLCFNCLTAHDDDCESKSICPICGEKHHSLLHGTIFKSVQFDKSTPTCTEMSLDTPTILPTNKSNLFATAQVIVSGPKGTKRRVRALINTSLKHSYVTESIAQSIELPKRLMNMAENTSNNMKPESIASLSLGSTTDSEFELETEVHVLPELSLRIPAMKLPSSTFEAFSKLKLADPFFFEADGIDLILGSDVCPQIIRPGIRHFLPSAVVANNTVWGWAIMEPSQILRFLQQPKQYRYTPIELSFQHI